ncbi:hypothetical protein MSAN_01534100 [Mycena sanguinolenta]|uniref:Uncharacterized protein n=1 Tax=Mycena sanguinolenta TaxID=230812 RepID=A0A8H6Y7V2_9AGAR|nr:hypothetical protein MSAN_01534100 [Mycena sanguinolenta]
MPSGADDVGILPQSPNSNASSSASSVSAVEPAPPMMPLPPALPPPATRQCVANGPGEFVDVGLFRGDGDLNFERDFGQWFNPDNMDLGSQTVPTMPGVTPTARPRTRASSLRRHATTRAAARPPPVPSPRASRSGEPSRRRRSGGEDVQWAGVREYRDDHHVYIALVMAGRGRGRETIGRAHKHKRSGTTYSRSQQRHRRTTVKPFPVPLPARAAAAALVRAKEMLEGVAWGGYY